MTPQQRTMTDIIERLREPLLPAAECRELRRQAADEIERLRAAVAAERERCAQLADAYASDGTVAWSEHFRWCAADIRRGPDREWRAKAWESLPVRQAMDEAPNV